MEPDQSGLTDQHRRCQIRRRVPRLQRRRGRLPLAVSSLLATIVYGSLPNLTTIATFGLLFLTLPAFYIALTVGLGTAIKSTAGVAGVAFAVMFVPQILGGLLPIIGEVSPTSIGVWAMATATGEPASFLTLLVGSSRWRSSSSGRRWSSTARSSSSSSAANTARAPGRPSGSSILQDLLVSGGPCPPDGPRATP